MKQIEIFEIPSPCIGVCQTNNRGYCLGCYRSREERFHWLKLTDEQKRNVIALCKQRKKRHQQKIQAAKDQAQNGTDQQTGFDF